MTTGATKPDWDTPPDGDFAAYVERLTAQKPLQKAPVTQAPAAAVAATGPGDSFCRCRFTGDDPGDPTVGLSIGLADPWHLGGGAASVDWTGGRSTDTRSPHPALLAAKPRRLSQ